MPWNCKAWESGDYITSSIFLKNLLKIAFTDNLVTEFLTFAPIGKYNHIIPISKVD
jgi:hypothetical protein